MIQGTGSDVGKSLIVAALCRIARRRGIPVAPFKPQNMSNNAAACEGGEIGRAQAVQARAAGLEPQVDFNPILLKAGDRTGKPRSWCRARLPAARAPPITWKTAVPEWGPCLRVSRGSSTSYELVVVEGAGSPAEVNLRAGDIANMGFARRVASARLPGGRHRQGRGHRQPGRDAGRARPGRRRPDPRFPHQQVPRRPEAVR